MRCRYGHEHPPHPVQQSQHSYSGRDGPLHCVACRYLQNRRRVALSWMTYASPEVVAGLVASERLCQWCFPERR